MSDADAARLDRELGLVTYLEPKPGVSGAPPGVARLEFWSGLFLAHGDADDEWMLEARTWGDPPQSLVHDWHVRAALAAKQLDPSVQVPRSPTRSPDTAATPPGSQTGPGRLLGHLVHRRGSG